MPRLTERGHLILSDTFTETGRIVTGNLTEQGQWAAAKAAPSYYLSLDGVDDKITISPSISFDKAVFDVFIDSTKNTSQLRYLFQSTNGSPGPFVRLPAGETTLTTLSGTTTGGVVDQRTTLTTTSTVGVATTDLRLFARADGGFGFMGANVYSVKFYNGDTLVVHYDMALGNQVAGKVQDQSGNGNHATLTGGTWVEEAPPAAYYLSMDGVDDQFKTPAFSYDIVEIDALFAPVTYPAYYFSSRDVASGPYASKTSAPIDSFVNIGPPTINGQPYANYGTIPINERVVVKWVASGLVVEGDGAHIFVRQAPPTLQAMGGRLYSVKFYNGATLVAHYDMTLGNVQDQSGNGRHATLTGGTWVDDSAGGGTGVTGSATLTGSGTLTASGQAKASGGATMLGAGSLVATGTTVNNSPSGSAVLSGSGSLIVSSTLSIAGSASLSGSGSLVATGTAKMPVYVIGIIQLTGERDTLVKVSGERENTVKLSGERETSVKLAGSLTSTQLRGGL